MHTGSSVAVVLAAGQGKRMGGKVQKQYLELAGKPVLYYALRAFEASRQIDEILLVVGDEAQIEYCREEITGRFGFQKVKDIITGGRERYDSVYRALCHLAQKKEAPAYVLIHDGARPFVTEEIIGRCLRDARENGACAAAMPAKDTIKLADENGFAVSTPPRDRLWLIQTPQVFSFPLIYNAYEKMTARQAGCEDSRILVTDDAMVVETFTDHKVKLTEGSYRNIKITTPEDLKIAAAFLE